MHHKMLCQTGNSVFILNTINKWDGMPYHFSANASVVIKIQLRLKFKAQQLPRHFLKNSVVAV